MDSLRKLIKQMILKELPLTISSGKVIGIEGDLYEIEREGLATLTDVRLNAIEGAMGCFIIKPLKGSYVLVGLIENKIEQAVILSCSEVDSIVFNDGELGGLTITPKLVEELNKNNEILNAILQVLQTPVNELGNGNPSVLQAALNSAVTGLPVGDFSEIEDDKFKH